MEELPNGFTGFRKRSPGFTSAGDAMRKSRRAAEMGREDVRYKESGRKAAQYGWQVPRESLAIDNKKLNTRSYTDPADMKYYLRVPDVLNGEMPPVYNTEALAEIPEYEKRWSWVQIDLSAIRHNTMAVKNSLQPGVRLMAVVKADGYGHGALRCAQTMLNSGAEQLAVATVEEGIQLREEGIQAPILILSEPPISAVPLLLAHKLMPSVFNVEFAIRYAEAADSIDTKAPYHLKINTGMNRIGVHYSEVAEFLRQTSFHRALELVGTFTHFATADESDTMEIERANNRFLMALDAMEALGVDPGIIHAANSAATTRFPQLQYDMVRVGLSLYGYYSTPEMFGMIDLIPAMSVHARITDVKNVPLGEGVSYFLTYRSGGYAKICTVPIGYADGLRFNLSNSINFVLNGKQVPQVGNICMDQCMFEVSQRSRGTSAYIEPQIGDEVLIVGAKGDAFATIDEMADILGSMSYEICIGFGNGRLPRVYV
ncbi:alanine racemase [Adlercreutzia sp. ZJ304]|uniref:alanine racemase n=1 Tax=Adlercreutzia sp. ZJ304 TaxID=2709791 RepID=UPI0013EB892A|nr:alanine racemase [Adlercreutzia sp. ZJ304]